MKHFKRFIKINPPDEMYSKKVEESESFFRKLSFLQEKDVKGKTFEYIQILKERDDGKYFVERLKDWFERLTFLGYSMHTLRCYFYHLNYFLGWLVAYNKNPFNLEISDIEEAENSYFNFYASQREAEAIQLISEEEILKSEITAEQIEIDDIRKGYNYTLSILKSLYKYLEGKKFQGEPIKNPFKQLRKLKTRIKKQYKYITKEQFDLIYKKISPTPPPEGLLPIQVALLLGYYAGLRVSEITKVLKKDVFYDEETGFLKIKIKGKGMRDREAVIYDKDVAKKIVDYCAYLDSDERLVPYESAYLCVFATRLTNQLRAEGIDIRFTFHKLRHSYATNLSNMGVPIQYIQYLLGHQSIRTTSLYLDIDTEKTIEILKKLGGEK
ncbi:MAG: tyrosine-type recombinase/integrase [Candidatus Aenigmatarchaeota archaeon]